ncbi:copper transporter [Brevibacillus humidisoli]|uniref:copper transporter n=1 Tax=Brevibacillus humidisoli TaxID=2895522 RepID=UPI001E5B0956|nr:copper transporter [Brevibacillus humidisoli]UFJ42893.1 copper transporter [Brevibacillus humidisoli]
MIHIRYHLVTIAAIFLALGIGILLGGTAGQSWFAARQQEFLITMEEKYDQALQSNNELKQQVNELIIQVEQSNEEVIHLMAARYADDLQGQKVYVWRPEDLQMDYLERVLASVGVQTVPFQPDQTDFTYPLLLFGKERPSWVATLPASCKWLHVETVPDTPAKQWKLLENVQLLLKEMRWEHEKS